MHLLLEISSFAGLLAWKSSKEADEIQPSICLTQYFASLSCYLLPTVLLESCHLSASHHLGASCHRCIITQNKPSHTHPSAPLLLQGQSKRASSQSLSPCVALQADLTSEIGSGSTTAHIWLGFGLNSLILSLQPGGRARRTYLSRVPSLLDWKVWEMPNS